MRREQLRCADADRQQVADRLRTALDEGRLSLAEFDERVRQAYAARTYGDLDALLADLPGVAVFMPRQPALALAGGGYVAEHTLVRYEDVERQWLTHLWRPYVVVSTICLLLWSVGASGSGDPLLLWPLWVMVPWAAALVVKVRRGLRSREPERWEVARVRRRLSRRRRRAVRTWTKDQGA
jgi:hypothetical protein